MVLVQNIGLLLIAGANGGEKVSHAGCMKLQFFNFFQTISEGYFYILRGANECGIEDYVLAAMADNDRKIAVHKPRRTRRRNRNSI